MVAAAWSGAADADVVLLLVDAEEGMTDEVKSIVAGLKEAGRRAVLALNKIDATRHESCCSSPARSISKASSTGSS
jgi:GTP-binding protein Era